MVFVPSGITPPKVNWCGWNLQHSEYIVGGWASHIWARSVQYNELEIQAKFFCQWAMHDFTYFPSAKFHKIWTQHVDRCCDENFWNNFENFPVRGHFSKKTQKFETFFNVSQLQATVTPQWLQIDGNSLPNDPSMGCLVSIFTIGINSESFPWPVHSIQESSPNSLHYRSDASWRHAAKCWWSKWA